MNEAEFNAWLASLPTLSAAQKQRLQSALAGADPATTVARELDALGVSNCPHCAAGSPVRFGHASGLQRYKCHACRRTFNVLTGTPLARLRHRDAWRVFAQALIDGESVRQSATKAGVHRNTAFRWRHRFLAAPAAMQAKRLAGIAEADETVMRRSYKGSRSLKRPPRQRGGGTKKSRKGRDPDDEVGVLVLRDREGHTLSNALDTVDHRTIDNSVGSRLEREAVLCTDGASVYQRYAQHRGVVHEPVNLAQGIRMRRPAFHVQNVNAYHSRWKGWMARFHGVATRYLDHYLGWHRMLDAVGESVTPHGVLAAARGHAYQHSTMT